MSIYAAESERLWLQLLNIDDHLEDYHVIMSHPECLMWSRKQPHTSHSETADLILQTTPTDQDPWRRVYAILLRPESSHSSTHPALNPSPESPRPKMIGVVGTPRQQELAYKIHPAYWGKGYMSEALSKYLELYWTLDGNVDEPVIRAFADPENLASMRVLQKAGFVKGYFLAAQYVRAINLESGKRSSLQGFYMGRPGLKGLVDEKEGMRNFRKRELNENEEKHELLKESIKAMLRN
ncbi:GNAT domain-containing protein [Bisporella sp. PMI_857]|nr:GNAT domain-containing protein [Bisporella sp. PMI_857]